MNWNLTEQLPETGNWRHNFATAIFSYMNAMNTHLKKKKRVTISVLSQPSYGLSEETDIEYGNKFLSAEISQYLFK